VKAVEQLKQLSTNKQYKQSANLLDVSEVNNQAGAN
jgi:hypothetical protein